MPQEKPKFLPFQRVVVKGLKNLNTDEYYEASGYFIRELWHLKEYWGKSLVRIGGVDLCVNTDQIEAADVKRYDP